MGRQLRRCHCKLHLSRFANYGPAIVGEAHRRQEGLTAQVMVAAGSRPDAQEDGPHAAVLKRDKIGMSGGLNGMPAPVAMTEDRIVWTGRKGSKRRIRPGRNLTMAVGSATLGGQQVNATMKSVEVRPLGPDAAGAAPDHSHGSFQSACPWI